VRKEKGWFFSGLGTAEPSKELTTAQEAVAHVGCGLREMGHCGKETRMSEKEQQGGGGTPVCNTSVLFPATFFMLFSVIAFST
jgi:hypothetical protein